MSTLGIDYGASKIGLAKSDEQNKMALPFEVLKNESKGQVLGRIKQICEEYDVTDIVIGVPISFSKGGNGEIRDVDKANKQMQEVLGFVDWLKSEMPLPVHTEDERLSTKMANSMNRGMIKNGSDDDVAAMLILQTYLDKLK